MTEPRAIIVHDHVYVITATNAPCPIPGHEDMLIGTSLAGIPAYWLERTLYTLRRKAQPKNYPDARMVTQ